MTTKHPLIAASVAGHIQWAAMLLVLLCCGAGKFSLDHVIWPRVRCLGGDAASHA